MAASMLSASFLPLTLSGVLMLALAVGTYALDPRKTVNRIFALLLTLRGLTFLIGAARATAGTEAQFHLWTALAPYTSLPLAFLTLYFVSVYPLRRGLGRWRFGGLATSVAICAILLWYALDHGALGVVEAGRGSAFTRVGASHHYASYGPLAVIVGLRLPALGIAGLLWARDYVRAPLGAPRNALFLVSAAFTLNALYDGTKFVVDLITYGAELDGYAWLPWGWALVLLPAATLIPAVLAVAVIARGNLRHPEAGPRRVARNYLLATLLPPASALFVAYSSGTDLAFADTLRDFNLGLWRLLLPLMVTYALLRYQLFDIQLTLKAGVRRGIVIGLFALSFTLTIEAMEGLIIRDRSLLDGVIIASVLALLVRPMRSIANHAADSLMPKVKALDQLTLAEKHQMYLDQLALAGQDEAITVKERNLLARLADTLGFTQAEVEALEAGRPLQVDEPPLVEETPWKAPWWARGLTAALVALSFGAVSQTLELLAGADAGLGLLAALVVSMLIGPIERATEHLAIWEPDDPKAVMALEAALRAALIDGVLSARDQQHLKHLESGLKLRPRTRPFLERRVRRELGLPVRFWSARLG